MKLYLRHGDLNFERVEPPTTMDGYIDERNFVLAGSHGGAHVLTGDSRVKRDGSCTYVHVLGDTTVTHADRHLDGHLEVGHYRVTVMRTDDGRVVD